MAAGSRSKTRYLPNLKDRGRLDGAHEDDDMAVKTTCKIFSPRQNDRDSQDERYDTGILFEVKHLGSNILSI